MQYLTARQISILEKLKADKSYTMYDIAEAAGIPLNTIRPIVQSLCSCGELVMRTKEKPVRYHRRGAFCAAYTEKREALEYGVDFDAMFKQFKGHVRGQQCAALRNIALRWGGTRKEFIEAASAAGLNRSNAAAEWQAGKRRC